MKRGTIIYYHQFNMLQFLTEDGWKTVGEFEAILRDKSRVTLVCQNEEKLNGACEPVMQNYLHDSLSRATMLLINAEQWSSEKR